MLRFFILGVFLIISQYSVCQNFEIGIGGGLSLYQGDLPSYSLSSDFFLKVNPAFGAKIRYNTGNNIAFSAGLLVSRLEGADSLASTQASRNRNLNFNSSLIEASIRGEWYPFGTYSNKNRKIDLYISSGINIFRFNPKTKLNGQEIELQALGTEGQGISQINPNAIYNLTQISIPIGGGLRFKINESIGLEGSLFYNYAFTDYLDDVGGLFPDAELLRSLGGDRAAELSNRNLLNVDGVLVGTPGTPRANPDTKDAYLTMLISLVFNLGEVGGAGKFCPSF